MTKESICSVKCKNLNPDIMHLPEGCDEFQSRVSLHYTSILNFFLLCARMSDQFCQNWLFFVTEDIFIHVNKFH